MPNAQLIVYTGEERPGYVLGPMEKRAASRLASKLLDRFGPFTAARILLQMLGADGLPTVGEETEGEGDDD